MPVLAHRISYYVINGITLYRVVAAPFLLLLLYFGRIEAFKWLLLLSFFTDFIDGFLARRFKVTSVLGSRLDSIGDDLTVLVGVIGLFVMHPVFLRQQKFVFIILLCLFLIQAGYALIKYRKVTSFHSYLAKIAAFVQGIFLLLVYFTGAPDLILFYLAAGITALELIEEIILVRLVPTWQSNLHGIYWILKKKRQEDAKSYR